MAYGRAYDTVDGDLEDWSHRGGDWASAEEVREQEALVARLEAEGWEFTEVDG